MSNPANFRRSRCAPSPRRGEGWGEGADLSIDPAPSPGALRAPTSPLRGEVEQAARRQAALQAFSENHDCEHSLRGRTDMESVNHFEGWHYFLEPSGVLASRVNSRHVSSST